MEKILDTTEKAFLGEFIRLSPKVNELSEILWFIFRMGGSVSSNIITPRFPDADKDLKNLVEMEILKEMSAGADKVVAFSEKFESRLLNKDLNEISVSDIFDTLIEGYSKDLGKRYKLDELIKRLSVVLSSVITYATPEEPAFLNKVFRAVSEEISGEVTPESLTQAKELLEYYLFKYLGLVQPVGSFAVNLSTKAAQVVSRNPVLLEAYKAKPKVSAPAKKPEKPEPE
jgi:valyl-tRNA synthetase